MYSIDHRDGIAAAYGNSVRIATGAASWTTRSDVLKRGTVIHEAFHCLQDAMTRKLTQGAGEEFGTWYMIEGSAEYAQFACLLDTRAVTVDEVMNMEVGYVRNGRGLPRIDEAYKVAFQAYPLAFLAVNYLLEGLGNEGMRRLGEYLRNVHRMPWRDAFERTFAMQVPEYEEKFEGWRKANGL